MSEERMSPEIFSCAVSRSTSFVPHFLIFFLLPFSPFAGDMGQMNLPVGMQSVNFLECENLTGTG